MRLLRERLDYRIRTERVGWSWVELTELAKEAVRLPTKCEGSQKQMSLQGKQSVLGNNPMRELETIHWV